MLQVTQIVRFLLERGLNLSFCGHDLIQTAALVSGVHANFLTHVPAKAASTALTCEDCGVRIISRLNYKIQAWRHVYDNLCIRLFLALVEAVLRVKKLALGK